MNDVSVLIPCYNEEKTIGKVVRDTRAALPSAVIYVYDNNSTDATAARAQEAGATVRREYMQGKGHVLRRMFREIDSRCYIIVDGDDTYSLERVREMARLVLEKNADMVVGDRLSSTYFTENKRPFHNFGNTLVRSSINLLFRCDIRDVMTGLRAVSYDFAKTFPILSNGFEIETEMTMHAVYHQMQVENVVIDYRDRVQGSVSKLNTYRDGLKVLRTIFSMYRNYRPLSFFGILAALLALISAAAFIPIFDAFVHTGVVDRLPTLVVSGFTAIAALLSLFTGLILSNQEKSYRRSFEVQRNSLHLGMSEREVD